MYQPSSSETAQQRFVPLRDVQPHGSSVLRTWERVRHRQAHWMVECAAEFTGVFFYTYCGVSSGTAFVLGGLSGQAGSSSIFQVGLAFAIGIALALQVCAPTSGGHINPGITITFALFRGFPWRKVPQYIIFQILGAYVACMLIYLQWRDTFLAVEATLVASGKFDSVAFTPSGPAGALALYVTPGSNLGVVFANEFFCALFIGITIFATLDPTNFLCPPHLGPFSVGLVYAVIIWGFVGPGLALNTARDVGSRLAALSIWGVGAGGGKYAAIAALVNIPASILACVIYDFAFGDSARVMTPSHRDFWLGHRAHAVLGEGRIVEYGQESQEIEASPVKEKQDIQHIP